MVAAAATIDAAENASVEAGAALNAAKEEAAVGDWKAEEEEAAVGELKVALETVTVGESNAAPEEVHM